MENKERSQAERGQATWPLFPWLKRLLNSAYRSTLAKAAAREILIGVGIFCALVAIMQVGLAPKGIKAVVGKPISQAVLAPGDMEDLAATRRSQEEAARRARQEAEQDPANWYIAPESGAHAEARLYRFLSDVEQARTALKNGDHERVTILERLRNGWPGILTEAWEGLLTAGPERFDRLRKPLRGLLISIEENERISEIDLRTCRENLAEIAGRMGGDRNDRVLVGILQGLVVPNLVLDGPRVDGLMEQARQRVSAVWYHGGQPILDKGEIVTKDKLELLKKLRLVTANSVPLVFLSLVLFVLALIVMAMGFLYRFKREVLQQERLLYLLSLTTIIAALLGKSFALNPGSNLAYFAPVTFASILWILLLDSQVALMMTVLLSLLMGVITGFQLGFCIYTLFGGSVAIFVLSERRQRSDLMRSGLYISLANVFAVILLSLLSGVPPLQWKILLYAALNGVAAAVIAIGLLPFLENLFGLSSAIRLLELANPNQPLLRRLLVEAPGTYHHSIIVGNLAEAAADYVGADALLVRVGAYYHDIGKVKRPYFFVENQLARENPHKKLTPTLSTLIITAHVKEGMELARQAGLPEAVVDILAQHHGTDLVRYFYARAAENTQAEVTETDFRYDGPRPQTKEAALVMLADSVEAAIRSLVKPTPAKIETSIEHIIKERLADGQFDRCDLTLRDLERIKTAFLKVLGGIFHARIEYPESILRELERKKGTNGDPCKQSSG